MNQWKKTTHVLMGIVLTFCMTFTLAVSAPIEAQAAEGFVQEYSDMIGQGGYIYYIRTPEVGTSADIYRMKVGSGQTSKVITAKNGIVDMVVSGQNLYYTTSNDAFEWEVWTCALNGSDAQKLCDGRIFYADKDYAYCMKYVNGANARLYCKNLSTGANTSIKTAKAGQTLGYAGNIGNDSYYYIYDGKTDKLLLYRLHAATKRLIRVATEKRVAKDSTGAMLVSDVRQISGELYYNFGSYEGTGNFWYGTVKKLTTDGKKKTVAKNVSNDEIIVGSRELYFDTPTGNTYKYSLKTGKKTKYSLKFEKDISYTVLGDKTYMADTSNEKQVVISRFNSGTEWETLTKNFITLPFRQQTGVSYAVKMKEIGIYNMIYIVGTDYSDMSYGWRGRLVSVDWFATDGAGTVLGSFQ